MKQKEIVLRASRFSLIMAFVLGTLFGLNSCRDEFNDEDALRAELEALAAARAQAAEAERQKMRDSLNLVLIAQAQDAAAKAAAAEAEREWMAFKDSLKAISGVFNLQVNVVYGNTATSAGQRTSGTANVDDAVVTYQQIRRSATTGEIFSTVYQETVTNGIVVLPELVTGEVALTVTKPGYTTAKAQVLLDAPSRPANCNCEDTFTPPVYNAAMQVPIWKIPTSGDDVSNEFSLVEGTLQVEQDLTNYDREDVSEAVVSAVIDGTDSFFNPFLGQRSATQSTGFVLGGNAIAEVQRISYEDAVFMGEAISGNYSIVLPGTGIGNGVPFRMQFGEIALDQKVIARVGDNASDWEVATVRATFGPEIAYNIVPNASALAPTASISGPVAGTGAGASAVVEVEADAGGISRIRLIEGLGFYSEAPRVYTSAAGGTTKYHPAVAPSTVVGAAATLDANGQINKDLTITRPGTGYTPSTPVSIDVKPYEKALRDSLQIVTGSTFDIFDQKYFSVELEATGGVITDLNGTSVAGTTLTLGGTGVTSAITPHVMITPVGGNPITPASITASVQNGAVVLSIENGGLGYLQNPILTIWKDPSHKIPFNWRYGTFTSGTTSWNGFYGQWPMTAGPAGVSGQSDWQGVNIFYSPELDVYVYDAAGTWVANGNRYGDADIAVTIQEDTNLPWDPTDQTFVLASSVEVGDYDIVGTAKEDTDPTWIGGGGVVSTLPAYLQGFDPSDNSSEYVEQYYTKDNPEGDDFTQVPTVYWYAVSNTNARVNLGRAGAAITGVTGATGTLPSVRVDFATVEGPHTNGQTGTLYEVESVEITDLGSVSLKGANFESNPKLYAEFVSSVSDYADIAAVFRNPIAVSNTSGKIEFRSATSDYVTDENTLAGPAFTIENFAATVDVKNDRATAALPGDANGVAPISGSYAHEAADVIVQGSVLYDAGGSNLDDNTIEIGPDGGYEGFGYVGTEKVTVTDARGKTSQNFDLRMGEGYVFAAELSSTTSGGGANTLYTEEDPSNNTGAGNPVEVTYLFLDNSGTGLKGEGDEQVTYTDMATPTPSTTETAIWRGGYATATRNAGATTIANTGDLSRLVIYDGGSYTGPPTTPEPRTDDKTSFRYSFDMNTASTTDTPAEVRYYMSFDQLDNFALSANATSLGNNVMNGAILIDNSVTVGSVVNGKLQGALPAVITVSSTNGVIDGVSSVLFRGRGYTDEMRRNANFGWATDAQITAVANILDQLNTFKPSTDEGSFDFVPMTTNITADGGAVGDDGTATQNGNVVGTLFPNYFASNAANFDVLGNQITTPTAGYSLMMLADDNDTANNVGQPGGTDPGDIVATVDPTWNGLTGFVLNSAAAATALAAEFDPENNNGYRGVLVVNDYTPSTIQSVLNTAIANATDNRLGWEDVDNSWDDNVVVRTAGATDDEVIAALTAPQAASTAVTVLASGNAATMNAAQATPSASVDASWDAAGVFGFIMPGSANIDFTQVYNPATNYAGLVFDVGTAAVRNFAGITNKASINASWNAIYGTIVGGATEAAVATALATAYNPDRDYSSLFDIANVPYAVDYFGTTTVGPDGTAVGAGVGSGTFASFGLNATIAAATYDAGGSWTQVFGYIAGGTTDLGNIVAAKALVTAPYDPTAANAAIRVTDTDDAIVDGYRKESSNFASPSSDFASRDITGRIDRFYDIISRGSGADFAADQVSITTQAGAGVIERGPARIAAIPRFAVTSSGATTSAILNVVATGSGYTGETLAGSLASQSTIIVERTGASTYQQVGGEVYIARELLGITIKDNDGANGDDINNAANTDNLFRESIATLTIDAPALAGLDLDGDGTNEVADANRARRAALYKVEKDANGIVQLDANNEAIPLGGAGTALQHLIGLRGSRVTQINVSENNVAYPYHVHNWVTQDARTEYGSHNGPSDTPHGVPQNLTFAATGSTIPGFSLGAATGVSIVNLKTAASVTLHNVVSIAGGAGYAAETQPHFIMTGGTTTLTNSEVTFAVTGGALGVASVTGAGSTTFNALPTALFCRDFRLMSWFDEDNADLPMVPTQGALRNVLVRNAGSVYYGPEGSTVNITISNQNGGNGSGAMVTGTVEYLNGQPTGRLVFDIPNGGIGYNNVPLATISEATTMPSGDNSIRTVEPSDVKAKVIDINVTPEFTAKAVGFTAPPYVYIRRVEMSGANPVANSEQGANAYDGLKFKAAQHAVADLATAEAVLTNGAITDINVTAQGDNYDIDIAGAKTKIYVYVTTLRNNGHQYAKLMPGSTDLPAFQLVDTDDVTENTDYVVTCGLGNVDVSSFYVVKPGADYSDPSIAPTHVVFVPNSMSSITSISTDAEILSAAQTIKTNWLDLGYKPALGLAAISNGEVTGLTTDATGAPILMQNGTGYSASGANGGAKVFFLNHKQFSLLATLLADASVGSRNTQYVTDLWTNATPKDVKANVGENGEIASVTWKSGTGYYYVNAPTVTISTPNTADGVQATATASISGGNLVSVTIDAAGAGYQDNIPELEYFSFGGSDTMDSNGMVTPSPLKLHLLSGRKLVRDAYYGTGLRADAQ